MAESILIGTRGWDRPDWSGARSTPTLCRRTGASAFYCNQLRAVLVPAEAWSAAPAADVRVWAEDAFPEFRFVVELSAASPSSLDILAPIRSQIARVAAARAGGTGQSLADGAAGRVLSVVSLVRGPAARGTHAGPARLPDAIRRRALLAHGHRTRTMPGREADGGAGSDRRTRAQRRLLETLAAWQGADGLAALFFEDPEAAKHARLLAELMVV